MSNKVVGSISITRVRTGDNITTVLSANKNLAQFYKTLEGGGMSISPDWSVSSNQPTITPKVYSTMDSAPSLSKHKWYYNGVLLEFDSEGVEDADSPRFQLSANGALTIVADLANSVNTGNDTLKYTAQVTANGLETNIEKELEVQILSDTGSNSYNLALNASSQILENSSDESTITASLIGASGAPSSYSVKWYINGELETTTTTTHSLTLAASDVNSSTLVTAVAVVGSTDVAQASVTILDYSDPYDVRMLGMDGVDFNAPTFTATISSYLYKKSDSSAADVIPDNATVKYEVFRSDDPAPIKIVEADTITINQTYTDYKWENGEPTTTPALSSLVINAIYEL